VVYILDVNMNKRHTVKVTCNRWTYVRIEVFQHNS